MRPKTAFPVLIVLAILFIGFGDSIFPKPLSTASLQTRTTLNKFVVGLFPQRKPRNVYERTEKAVEQEEKGK